MSTIHHLTARVVRVIPGNRDFPVLLPPPVDGSLWEGSRIEDLGEGVGTTTPVYERQTADGTVTDTYLCVLPAEWSRCSGQAPGLRGGQLIVRAMTHGTTAGQNAELEWLIPDYVPAPGGGGGGGPDDDSSLTAGQQAQVAAMIAAAGGGGGGGNTGMTVAELAAGLNTDHDLRAAFGNLITSTLVGALTTNHDVRTALGGIDEGAIAAIYNSADASQQHTRDEIAQFERDRAYEADIEAQKHEGK